MNLHRHEIKDRQTRERERDQTDSQSDTGEKAKGIGWMIAPLRRKKAVQEEQL